MSAPIFDYARQELWTSEAPLCGKGLKQSPIDLYEEGASNSANLKINGYGYENMKLVQVKRTATSVEVPLSAGQLQVAFADGSYGLFDAVQIQFRAPSEHTYLGQHFDLELQILHKHKGSQEYGAALAIFFDRKHGTN